MNSSHLARPRKISDGHFCWQDKFARRRIRSEVEKKHHLSTLSLYDGLSEAASDSGSETFQITQDALAELSGISPRTLQRCIRSLEELGLVHVKKNSRPTQDGWRKMRSTYTLLQIRHDGASMNASRKNTVESQPLKEQEEETEKRLHDHLPENAALYKYTDKQRLIIEVWDDVAVRSGLGFLPVTIWTRECAESIDTYDSADECRQLFLWVVKKEKTRRTSLTKSLTRVLRDCVTGTGLCAEDCVEDDNDIPI